MKFGILYRKVRTILFIINNLLLLLEKKGLKQADLCEAIGISSSTMTNWKNRGTDPPAKYIIPICEFLNITPYLLLANKESSPTIELKADEQELIDIYQNLSTMNKGRLRERAEMLAELEVPVANETTNEIEPEESRLKINCSTYQVSAGAGFELGEGDEWYEIEVPDTPEARKADFALQIKGNSMEPIYFDGDIVLVKEQPSVDLGQIGIFNIEGSGYIKKFGGDRLISLNAEYDDIVFSDYDEDRIQCFGKVIGRV